MANYYTYGTIPNAEETVYGPLSQGYAEGGEVDEAVPADRGLPEEPYYEDNPQPNYNLFVEGADVPTSSGLNIGALDQLFANLRKTEELQKMALEPGLLQQGFTGATGAPSAPMGTGIRVPQAAPSGPAIDFEVTPEMAGALQEVARPAEITAAERAAVQENPRVQALSRISGLLEADDFRGAFDAALKAEQDLGGDFIGNLVDPNKMKMLRGPMDAQEITKFYNEMPQKVFEERYLGPGNEFKKEQAIERNIAALGGEAGYVDPTLGVKKEETLLGKLPIKELAALAAAAMGATAIPGLFGAGSTGGAGAAGGAAGGAGAAGATGAGALTGVVPTGLIPGAVSAAGLGTATFPIVAGAGLSAAEMAALAAAAGGAGAAASGAGGSTSATQPTPPEPGPLEEVVVQSLRKGAPVDINTLLASTGAQGAQDILSERQIQEQQELEQREAQEQAKEKEPSDFAGTFEITADRLPQLDITKAIPNLGSQLYDAGYRPPGLEGMPADDLAEVVVRGSKPVDLDLTVPIPDLSKQFSRPPYDKPAFADTPLEEVVVKTGRPTELDLVAPPFDIPKTTKPSIKTPEGALEEIVVEGKRPDDLDLVAPPFTIPGKTPVEEVTEPKINEPNPLKGLLDKYGSVENFLKLIGALGSAFSKAPKAPTGGAGIGTGGGMGGALPKYNYARQQLSPDIDYYTYGTRPEAKFFEDKLQLEKPVQPELPPAKPPEPDMVMATGGLTGYAKGGSKSSRYVDGPGSGRGDKIPALLSDGEYVIDAETLALLGDGSTKEGARRMDQFRANIRKHKGRALSRGRISPNAKSPSKYMGGGLT
jgi:hypothetical protein